MSRWVVWLLALVFSLPALPVSANPSLKDSLAAAKAGDRGAQYVSGMMLMFGQGTAQNLPEAARWLEASAKAGLPQAMVALAVLYDVGQGVPQDSGRAAQWRLQAARAGNPTAKGQIEDDRRLRGHADFRRAQALTDLRLYREALPYARRAADAGSPSAQLLLGRAHHFGLGTPKDLGQAARLYRASADGGLPDGAWGLAYLYEFGLGVPADRKTALAYYDRAAAGGNQRARQAAANLRSPDYDAPRNQRAGSGSAAQCGGSYSYNYASGSCSPMVPGLQPYNP